MRPLSLIAVFLLCMQGTFLEASDANERLVDRITGNLVCVCGCANMLVRNCACGTAARMAREVSEGVEAGRTEQEVYAAFKEQYGQRVLAAPGTEGFNLLAWVLPFLVLAFGTGVVLSAVKKLMPEKRIQSKKAKTVEIDEKYRNLLNQELRE
jgi:cytochrome c-type biogenesis protein CcmH